MVGRSLLGGGMSKFLVCGGLAGGLPHPQPLSPIPPVGKTLQVAFKKHGLHSMPQGLRVSCKTYFLF